MRTIDLTGKTALVLGVANQRSLAWAIAESLGEAGCRLAFTYQGERLKENVTDLASKYPDALVLPCDVTSDAEIDATFAEVAGEMGKLDALIHSVAFARREDLEGEFRKTSREGWHTALDISAYSLVALANRAAPLMEKEGGSIVALTFQASQWVFPNYNVMGSAKAALENAVRQLAYELGAFEQHGFAFPGKGDQQQTLRAPAAHTTQRQPKRRPVRVDRFGVSFGFERLPDLRSRQQSSGVQAVVERRREVLHV